MKCGHKKTNVGFLTEITCVGYVTTISNKDYTVVYYDNSHSGVMHRHIRNSVQDPSESLMVLTIKKKGNQAKLLHWAIEDIKNNWYPYRKKFYKRSKLKAGF